MSPHLPSQIIIGSYSLLGALSIAFGFANWWYVLLWFLFYALGDGTVSHRYFSHNSFQVGKKTRWVLALWSTFCAYSSTAFWITQHRHHHRHEDDVYDAHSPRNGFFKSLGFWVFDSSRLDRVFRDRTSVLNYGIAMRDPVINFTTRYFVPLNLAWLFIVGLLSTEAMASMFAAYLLEQLRLGLVNSVLHMKSFPFNYQNHKTGTSQNNYLLGFLTLGFGWHNNHHADPRRLILSERWWELDVEGYLGWLLSRSK